MALSSTKFFAELRRCRKQCTKRDGTDHRTQRSRRCDDRCQPHQGVGQSAWMIREIHTILKGAFARACVWKYVGISPMDHVSPPEAPRPNPQPPTAEEAARLLLARRKAGRQRGVSGRAEGTATDPARPGPVVGRGRGAGVDQGRRGGVFCLWDADGSGSRLSRACPGGCAGRRAPGSGEVADASEAVSCRRVRTPDVPGAGAGSGRAVSVTDRPAGRAGPGVVRELAGRASVRSLPVSGRGAAVVAEGLRSHPGVEVVCWDGSAAYAQAVRDALPNAVQVADR
jgi:hypothetical protein